MGVSLLALAKSIYYLAPRLGDAKKIRKCICLVPRRLSLDENVRAKGGGKDTTLPMVACGRGSSPVTRVSRSPLR